MSFRAVYRNPLSTLSKNSSRNPTPGRKREKDVIPTPPAYPKPSQPQKSKQENQTFMINLEDLLIIERNLSFIIENFSNSSSASVACGELWDLTADNTLNQVSSLYRDENKRNLIRYSMVLQSAGIATVHYFISQYNLNNEIA